MSNVKLASFFLRIGLAVVFLYAALSSFLDPSAWIGFFPLWVQQNLPVTILLFAFSIYEILLALWLLSAWKAKEAAIVAAATLSYRYISDRFLPDKAIDLIDEAGSQITIEISFKPI